MSEAQTAHFQIRQWFWIGEIRCGSNLWKGQRFRGINGGQIGEFNFKYVTHAYNCLQLD
jgi:hypothetical protein